MSQSTNCISSSRLNVWTGSHFSWNRRQSVFPARTRVTWPRLCPAICIRISVQRDVATGIEAFPEWVVMGLFENLMALISNYTSFSSVFLGYSRFFSTNQVDSNLDQLYVVYLRHFTPLGDTKPVFSFQHPNFEKGTNEREGKILFDPISIPSEVLSSIL